MHISGFYVKIWQTNVFKHMLANKITKYLNFSYHQVSYVFMSIISFVVLKKCCIIKLNISSYLQ